ncbi:PREDICTED: probable inactive serine/threonine-protein kinase fnkC [Ipomoea nil]|uniref:probable inactive serine/threonine-protein kinase fnkC n=1 Tax=Ipomoea nil TaxID=35883 RepID=UPI000901934E|nr:PREDICTED: probable inactive serine/threonine-protein kinase fnkC [Ipomoea nil]
MADTPKEEGIVKTVSDAPPSHYVVKIQSVSLLRNNIDQYISDAFDVGGYKWKLVIHPNGNKNKKVNDHISLYLKLADTSNLHPGWEVHAVIRLFLYDQKKDNYYVVQDAEEKTRRFRAMKEEWGYDRFIVLTEFNNVSNGYVVDDVCVFGVEVSVRKEIKFPGRDCLTLIQDPVEDKLSWEIKDLNFRKDCYESNALQYWKIQIYPKGYEGGKGTHVSVYLALAEAKPSTQIYAEFIVRMIDQSNSNHISSSKPEKCWFNATNAAFGWPKFISIEEFRKPEYGYLVNGSCRVEAEIKVLGMAEPDAMISNNSAHDCKEIILT